MGLDLHYVFGQHCSVHMKVEIYGSTESSGAANGGGGGQGARAPTETYNHKIFTDYEKYETCPVNRKVKSITGSVFVFVSRLTRGCAFGAKCTRNCLAAPPGPAGRAHNAAQTP